MTGHSSHYDTADFGRTVFDESNDAIFVVDPKTMRILDVNATALRITGWSRHNLLEATIDQLLHGIDSERTFRFLNACRQTGFFHSKEEYTVRLKSGGKLFANVSVSRLHASTGPLALVVIRDVTEKRQAVEALRVANTNLQRTNEELRRSRARLIEQERARAFEEMAGGIAHDLNNSLTPIVIFASLLLERKDLNPEVRDQLSLVQTAGRDAVNMVRDLQVFRFDGPQQKEDVVDLRELLQQLPELMRHDSGPQGRYGFQLGLKQVPRIVGNESDLRRVFTNVVRNSMESMHAGGTITIELEHDGDSVVVELADTGSGLSDDERLRCFDPFFTTKERGTGLGLSVCQHILQRHDGTIEIHRTQPGGTCVRIALPVRPVPSKVRRAGKPESDLSAVRILYIDDNEWARESARALLAPWNVEVDLAESGSRGIEMVGAVNYDAVVTDFAMPDINGSEVVRQIRAKCPSLPIIVISGWHESQIVAEFSPSELPDHVIYKVDMAANLPEVLMQIRDRSPSSSESEESDHAD